MSKLIWPVTSGSALRKFREGWHHFGKMTGTHLAEYRQNRFNIYSDNCTMFLRNLAC